jgi:hypothetical protein
MRAIMSKCTMFFNFLPGKKGGATTVGLTTVSKTPLSITKNHHNKTHCNGTQYNNTEHCKMVINITKLIIQHSA